MKKGNLNRLWIAKRPTSRVHYPLVPHLPLHRITRSTLDDYSKMNQTRLNPNKDKVIIGDEWTGEDNPPSYVCNYCNRTLNRLIDSGGQNLSYYCNSCSIEYNPDNDNVRRESKLGVPNRDIEPAVATTPGIQDISIKHEPKLKGGFAQLAKKGTIRFTSYSDSSQ